MTWARWTRHRPGQRKRRSPWRRTGSAEPESDATMGDAGADAKAGSDSARTEAGSEGGSDLEGAPFCIGGCLCFSTPETCPSDCLRTHGTDGSFVCGYACDAPGVPCNCVYHPDDGGIYVCDSFTLPACPISNALSGSVTGPCDSIQSPCMTCGGSGGPAECVCGDGGPTSDGGSEWFCLGTEQACAGP